MGTNRLQTFRFFIISCDAGHHKYCLQSTWNFLLCATRCLRHICPFQRTLIIVFSLTVYSYNSYILTKYGRRTFVGHPSPRFYTGQSEVKSMHHSSFALRAFAMAALMEGKLEPLNSQRLLFCGKEPGELLRKREPTQR